jgi:hypothetical protein
MNHTLSKELQAQGAQQVKAGGGKVFERREQRCEGKEGEGSEDNGDKDSKQTIRATTKMWVGLL